MESKLTKWGRGATILVLLVVSGAVIYSFYRRSHLFRRPETTENKILPENVAMATKGFSYSQTEQGRTTFEVAAQVNLGFKNNRNLLENVTVRVLGKEGNRYDTITSQHCEYDQALQEILFLDNVVISLSGGSPTVDSQASPSNRNQVTTLRMDRIRYSHQTGSAQTDDRVTFSRGRIHGSALGLTYDTRLGSVFLPAEVDVRVDPLDSQDSSICLKAGSLKYSKFQNLVELRSRVDGVKGYNEIKAEAVNVFLDKKDSTLTRIDAAGAVEMTSSDPQHLFEMRARRASSRFAKGGRWIEKIQAQEDVKTRSLDPLTKRDIAAAAMEILFRPQSTLLTSLKANGKVRCVFSDKRTPRSVENVASAEDFGPGDRKIETPSLLVVFKQDGKLASRIEARGPSAIREFPLLPGQDQRIISALEFNFLFAKEANVLEKFTANRQVKVDILPAAGPPRQTSSEHLEALLDKNTRQIDQLHQFGKFRYREDERQAVSDDARYFASGKVTILRGHAEAKDNQARTVADVIELRQNENLVKAQGAVRSVLYDQNPKSRPGMFKPTSPVYASADFMETQTQSGVVKYWKRAKLWQDDQVLRGQTITLYRNEKRVVAEGDITSLFYAKREKELAHSQPESAPTVVLAERLTYEDKLQRMVYENKVRLHSSMGRLNSDRLEVYLGQEGNQTTVQKMIANGHVKVQQLTRTSYSDSAEYLEAEERVILWGGPPRILDSERGFTTGARLTMYLNDDRISVDGDSENRATTRQDVAR